MGIEYVEIRSKNSREVIGIIDGAKSVLWVQRYFTVGEFEIYAQVNAENLKMLQDGNYVTRPNDYEDGFYKCVGLIEHIEILNNPQDGLMIVASGRFVKSVLDRRHIYRLQGTQNTPTILKGNVQKCARDLVRDNAINCTFDTNRNIAGLVLGAFDDSIHASIEEDKQKQVSYENLLSYSDELLEEYNLGSFVGLNDVTKDFEYVVFAGEDKSDEVVFSDEYDNLTESNYLHDTATVKTTALIGGEGEGLERFYAVLNVDKAGLERRETWVDASSINKTYKYGEEERTYTEQEYRGLLTEHGKQIIATLSETETFDGKINVSGGVWRLGTDYNLGDIVTLQDTKIGKYVSVRIVEITEAQDENGYSIEVTYRGVI